MERRIAASIVAQRWRASLDEAAVSVGWSASGSWLAAASATGTVCVFNAADGTCDQQLSAHRFGATQLVWHPRNAVFATAGQDGYARLWAAGQDRATRELDCGAEWVEHIAWSDDGRLLATAAGRKLKIWSQDGCLMREFPDHPNTIAAIEWKAGADELASACYGHVRLWTPDRSEARRSFAWKGSMLSLAWSPNGRYLCHGNQDATVHLWDVSTGEGLQMQGYRTKVRGLAWDHRSRYLATDGGSSIAVWDCSGAGPARSRPTVLIHHSAPVTHFAYQHSGDLLASGCGHGKLALWKPGRQAQPSAVAELPAAISGIAWSPHDDMFAAVAEDGSVAVYRLS
jgi:WD40 repeat protein